MTNNSYTPQRLSTTLLIVLLSILIPITEALSSASDDFPNKPLTMVVGFGIGGSADRMTRMVTPFLAKELGQPIKVINKKGAGTLLSANYVLDKEADGYTLYASAFSPYLLNTILNNHADYGIDDFAYMNFQWFDEDLIAISKRSKYKSLDAIIEAIRTKPKTVKASVVKGSAGHLIAKLLLEVNDIPQQNLNLVTYNGGGLARAAVAGGIVDFIIISAKGCEGIRDYINPVAIGSHYYNDDWQVPSIKALLKKNKVDMPVLPGSIRGFATAATVKSNYPERFALITDAFQRALNNPELQQKLKNSAIGGRWVGPQKSTDIIHETFSIFKNYSYLLEL